MINSFSLNINKFTLFIVSFFLYTGYYAGLEILISLGLKAYSRYYSIPVRLFFSIVIILFIIKNINKKFNNTQILMVFMFLILFLDYILMIFLNIGGQDYSLGKFEYLFYYLTWSFLVFIYFSWMDFNERNYIIKYFIYSGSLMSIISFFLYKDYFFGGVGRISQLMYEGNDNFISPLVLSYASVINFIACFCYFKEFKDKNNFLTSLVIIALILSIPMFVLGASRGSFIAVILCFIYIWNFSNLKNKIISSIVVPIFIYIVYWITNATGNNAFERFFNIKSDLEEGSSSTSRLDLWSKAWDYFIQSPIYGGYLEVNGIYPHNIFFELLMNVGLFGFILFFIPFLYLCIYYLLRINIKHGYFIPLIILLGLCMHLFSGAIYFAPIIFAGMGLALNGIYYRK